MFVSKAYLCSTRSFTDKFKTSRRNVSGRDSLAYFVPPLATKKNSFMTSPPGRGKPPRPPDPRQGRVDDAEPLAAALPQDRVRQQGRTQDAEG